MNEPDRTSRDLYDEIRNAPYEPLLPIEKKLIGWSLGLGVALLGILALLNAVFPAAS